MPYLLITTNITIVKPTSTTTTTTTATGRDNGRVAVEVAALSSDTRVVVVLLQLPTVLLLCNTGYISTPFTSKIINWCVRPFSTTRLVQRLLFHSILSFELHNNLDFIAKANLTEQLQRRLHSIILRSDSKPGMRAPLYQFESNRS